MWALFCIATLFGMLLSPGVIDVAAGAMLIAFQGMISAGIVSTMTLMVASSFQNRYSIKRLDEQYHSLNQLMGVLFQTLMIAVFGAVLAILSSWLNQGQNWLEGLSNGVEGEWEKWVLTEFPLRFLQGIAIASFIVVIDRLRVIKIVLSTILRERYEAKREEIEERIKISSTPANEIFARSSEFGKVVPIGREQNKQ